ncbi:auxin efflux carrier [Dichotomocladium elegans]|nr:auxin efflux carrier [Dichotomocladium elegans]
MLTLVISAVQAVLQVMAIVFFGFLLTQMAGIFNMDKQKWLSKLNLFLFTPCLLFSNIASIISLQKLIAYWPIPVFYFVFSSLSWLLSHGTSKLIRLNPSKRRFVTACAMFGNTNSLPIAIISSLTISEASAILLWDAADTAEAATARGISYTLFYAIFGNLLRWSYGYGLLRKQDGVGQNRMINPPLDAGCYGATYDELNADRPLKPERLSSSITIAVPHATEDVKGTPLPVSSLGEISDRKINQFKRVLMRLHRFMSPPLYAAFLALVVGLTPIKPLLFAKDSYLYPCLTKAIEVCGHAAVPIILVCLGAQLTMISAEPHGRDMTAKAVFTAIFVRMALMPLFVIPIILAFAVYGPQWSLLATDPVFITMMIVLGCSPTAINLVQITQVNGAFEDEMLRVLFWTYGVVCIPVCTLVVFCALSIVDKLV